MPLFEDPAHLSKSRLKADLVAHSVALPPPASRKEVYVELHLKHIQRKNAADFSSDEDEQAQDVADKEDPEERELPDPSGLTDEDLKAALLVHGVKAGPIVASTRALYEKKLRKLLQSGRHERQNGAEKDVLYSDSEEEEEDGEEEEEEDGESGSEAAKEEKAEQLDQAQQNSVQRVCAPRSREPCPTWNSGNALKPSKQSQSQIPVGISRASSVDQWPRLGSGMESRRSLSASMDTDREVKGSRVQRANRLPEESVENTLKDVFPDSQTTPTGIYVTRRRPIKGAAGRPVQYPESPASPTTLQRREVERRLVPVHIQILVFLTAAGLLYLIYVCVEESSLSPFMALLDSLAQETDSEDGLYLQADTPAASGLDQRPDF